MSNSTQMIIAGLPYVITLFLLLGYISPSLDSANRTKAELTTLTNELDRLAKKVAEKEVLLEQKRVLDKDILRMRSAVPPAPEMDILLMDIERLSDETGTDLIAVEPLSNSKKEKGGGENLMDSIMAEVGGRITPPGTTATTAPPRQKAPALPLGKPEEKLEENPLGIRHIDRRVFVSGTYSQLVSFLKKLEAYQRIVGVSNLVIALPENSERETIKTLASEKGRSLDLSQPVMTFMMSVYYLP